MANLVAVMVLPLIFGVMAVFLAMVLGSLIEKMARLVRAKDKNDAQ